MICYVTVLSNYRPIGNISILGKMIKKDVFNQIIMYLNKNNLLDDLSQAFKHRLFKLNFLMIFALILMKEHFQF